MICFPCPRSRLIIWSCGTGSAVPSRVSLLNISILRLNVVLTSEIPPEFHGGVYLFIELNRYTVGIFQGFTWTAKISTGRDGGKIDGWPTFFISAGARDWQNIGVEILGGTGRDGTVFSYAKLLAGRDGCFFFRGGTGRFFFFPRRDGVVVFFFRGGTGRGGCVFSAPGPGGCIFCSRRDGRFFLTPGRGG